MFKEPTFNTRISLFRKMNFKIILLYKIGKHKILFTIETTARIVAEEELQGLFKAK